MEETRIGRKFKLDLEVMSPLAINSGEYLSPLSDYFVLNDKLHHVDAEGLQVLLLDTEISDMYEKAVESININEDPQKYQNFLNGLFSLDQLSLIQMMPSFDFKESKTLVLKSVIKSNGNPFVPGSSIKGAIKNAVLYYWITQKSPKTLEEFILRNRKIFLDSIANQPRLLELGEQKKRIRLEDNKFKEFKKLLNESRRIKKILVDFTKQVEQQAFSIVEKSVLRQPASNLVISDSCAVGKERLAIANVSRRSLNPKVEEWDLHTQEYIKPDTIFSFVCSISSVENDWIPFSQTSFFVELLQSADRNLGELLKVLNHFHLDALESQKQFSLNQPMCKLKSNEAILHLGSSKGIYHNTVLLAIRKYYDAQSWNFKKEFAPLIAHIKDSSEDFPNSVCHIKGEPMGWIKLIDRDVESYKDMN
jgi:CRISPR-associated protein Csm5